MSYGIDRAIEQGIDSARFHRKEGQSPYHDNHPLFPFWWTAVVTKSDLRDLSDRQIRERVLKQVKPRRMY